VAAEEVGLLAVARGEVEGVDAGVGVARRERICARGVALVARRAGVQRDAARRRVQRERGRVCAVEVASAGVAAEAAVRQRIEQLGRLPRRRLVARA
jgi:hypothetical protein